LCAGLLVTGWFCEAMAFGAPVQPEVDEFTVLHWRFDETPSEKSATGTYHALGVSNLPLVEGRFGKALDGHALAAPVTVLFSDTLGFFSVEYWVYFNQVPAKAANFLSHLGVFAVGPGEREGLRVEWKLRLDDGDTKTLSSPDIPVRQWVHVRSTYEPGGVLFLINGQEAGRLEKPGLGKYQANIMDVRFQLRVSPFAGHLDELQVSQSVRDGMPAPRPTTEADKSAKEAVPLARTTQIAPCASPPSLEENFADSDGGSGDGESLLLPLNERHSYIHLNTLPKAVLTGATRMKLCFDRNMFYVSLRGTKLHGASPRPEPQPERYEIVCGADGSDGLRTITVLENGRFEVDESSSGEGIVVRTRADADRFDAEIALPSSLFGLSELEPGGELLFNVQRHQAYGETSAWSLVEKDSRAGVATLAEDAGSRRSVVGRVVDAAGKAVMGAVVRSAWDMTWTDLSGHFTLDGIYGDSAGIRVDSEYHHPAHYRFPLDEDREILPAMALTDKKQMERSHFITDSGPEYQDFNLYFHGIPSIARLPGGRLFVSYYGGDADEGGLNHCALVTSDDDGETWSKPILVIDAPGDKRAYDPVVWLDPKGRLWMFWAGQGIRAIFCENPEAEELTWSDPVTIGGRVALNSPIVLDDGTWLLTVDQAPHKSSAYVSTDEGKSWTLRGTAEVPAGGWAQEPMTVQRKDGSLLMMIRTSNGIDESYSHDRGKTWTVSKASDVQSMIARFHISRMPSGRLLLVCHDQPNLGWGKERRKNLTAFLSDDEGKTWPHKLLIDERDNVTYPDAAVTGDGRIYIVYDYRRSLGKGEILMADIREKDILAGSISQEKSRLRRPVSKGSNVIE
jgi:predicted neuraminidase